MQQTVVPGVSMWPVWQPERNSYFNSFSVASTEENLVIGPFPKLTTVVGAAVWGDPVGRLRLFPQYYDGE